MNHGGTSRPAGCRIASLRPLVVPPSCPAPSIAVALTVAPSIACRRRALRRRRAVVAAAASALLSRCRRRAVRLRRCRRRSLRSTVGQHPFWRFLRIRIKIDALRKKIPCLTKKGIPPSPQVFRNSFDNVRSEIKILSQTKTNYIYEDHP